MFQKLKCNIISYLICNSEVSFQMKIFLSYRFTGVTLEEIHKLIDPIVAHIRNTTQHEVYCNLYDLNYYEEHHMGTKEIMDHALKHLAESQLQIVLFGETGWKDSTTSPNKERYVVIMFASYVH